MAAPARPPQPTITKAVRGEVASTMGPPSRTNERQAGQQARRRRREQHADGDRAGPEGQRGQEGEDEVIGRGEEHYDPESHGDGQDSRGTPDEREPVAGVAGERGAGPDLGVPGRRQPQGQRDHDEERESVQAEYEPRTGYGEQQSGQRPGANRSATTPANGAASGGIACANSSSPTAVALPVVCCRCRIS